MKRIISYLLLLLFIIPVSLLGQVEQVNGFCISKDFQFRLEYENDDIIFQSFFLNGEEPYLCTSTLPFELVIVNSDQEVIVPYEMVWLKEVVVDGIGGSLSEIGGNFLEINEDDYSEDNVIQLNISVDFKLFEMDPDFTHLELTIYRNKVDFTQIKNTSRYAYDDNEIEAYIGEYSGDLSELNNPWNFLLIGPQDAQGNPIPPEELRGRIDKEKWINFVPESIIADDNVLTINPAQVAPNREANISFDHDPLVDDKIIEVHSCDKDPELLLYAGGLKTFDIQVFQVCESDDDMREIAMGVGSLDPLAVCISAGPDGSIDIGRDANFYTNQNDVVANNSVVAGMDGICSSRMFREPVNGGPAGPPNVSDCTPLNVFQTGNQLTSLNTLASKVGVRYTNNIANVEIIAVNFDARVDDGLISDGQERGFLAAGIELLGDPIPMNSIFTYLVSDLGALGNPSGLPLQVAGRATSFGSSRVSLDIVDANHFTWFHEIGHAFSSLRHPDERDDNGNKTENYLAEDKENFMFSNGTGRINNVRRYQFGPIRGEQ